MARTSAAKLTSEERCEAAFARIFNSATGKDGLPLQGEDRDRVLWGFRVCWKYLQEQAVKEFIER